MLEIAESLFWTSLAALFYVYLGYPILLLLIGCFVRRTPSQSGYTPRISVLIAAYNEQAGIREKIEKTLQLDYPSELIEIVVLSDESTDRTDAIVESFQDPRVRLLRIGGRRGKTNAQNEGMMFARGKVVIFSDATTVYHPQSLRYLVRNYSDPRVGAVSGRYQYFDAEGRSPTSLGTIAFWNYENLIKMMQSRISTISGCCGCIYSVRRDLYTALSPDIISDLVQPLHVIRQGYKVVFEDRALAYEETTRSVSEEFSMRVRVVTRGMRGLLSISDLLRPWKFGWVSFQLWSHKALRWFVPLFLLGLFAANLALLSFAGFRLFFWFQAAFYFLALLCLLVPLQKRWKLLGIPLYFCTLNAAALCGMVKLLRGEKYTVWQTVRT
jgi:cellulose synthase/poly-beta-1,6-N-acetylglucosamine synthase-like glycosyltransferase